MSESEMKSTQVVNKTEPDKEKPKTKVDETDILATAKAGHGSQVVKVLEDHSYELDDEELKNILLREEYKDLPVAVISVAGIFRSGKSFLLNLFLRYLTSTTSAREDGSWLGVASEPLTGFSWRGGSMRNTTGILLWSEPVIITKDSGEKVAVLIMDTQGTFDNESTVKDCSTIFALSTLLSSVQIYNLTMNIKEDDMQHLQLFTAYGNLAQKETTTKPFQVLEFLVRDWQYPYEYPFGTEGGESYLKTMFKVTDKTPKEIKLLREQLQSSFEKMTCYLMPHPGYAVMNPKYKGFINELLPDFRTNVVNLTQQIFSPKNLVIKSMNGEQVKARELYTYFESYMTIFNSTSLPNPTIIMEATIKANLLNASSDAREHYTKGMRKECGPDQPSIPASDLKDLHIKYISSARKAFFNKKIMGSPENANACLEELTKVLDKEFLEIEINNQGKLQTTLDKSKSEYANIFADVSQNKPLCLHPLDLQDLHQNAFKKAIEYFKAHRKYISTRVDEEKAKFEQSLDKYYETLKFNNDVNNKQVVTEILSQYSKFMENKCSLMPPLKDDDFIREHDQAFKLAQNNFEIKRNRLNSYPEDIYKQQLKTAIKNVYTQLKTLNTNKYEAMARAMMRGALNDARTLYEKEMQRELGIAEISMPIEDVEKLHNTNLEKAKATFTANVTMGAIEEAEFYLKELIKELEGRLSQIQENNNSKLQTMIRKCEDIYISTFQNTKKEQFLCLHPQALQKLHEDGIKAALKLFDHNRKLITSKTDTEKAKLEQILKQHYQNLENSNEFNNKALVAALLLQYLNYMETKCSLEPPLSDKDFKEEHELTLKKAEADIETKRNKDYNKESFPEDNYKASLRTEINAVFHQLNNINTIKYNAMMQSVTSNAINEARKMYDLNVMAESGFGQVSIPVKDLEELHRKYIEKAKELFKDKTNKIITENEISKYIEELIQELEQRFILVKEYNTSKFQATIKNATNVYEERIDSIKKPICMHPDDLQDSHNAAVIAAMEVYTANRKLLTDNTDEEKTQLDSLFKKRYDILKTTNEKNNKAIVQEIHTEYWRKMKYSSIHTPPYSEAVYYVEHELNFRKARDEFKSKRQKSIGIPDDVKIVNLQDEFKEDMEKKILSTYADFRNINNARISNFKILEEQRQQNKRIQENVRDAQNLYNELQRNLERDQRQGREQAEQQRAVIENLRSKISNTQYWRQIELDRLLNNYSQRVAERNRQINELRNYIYQLSRRLH